jgi:hypothetical protein
MAHDKLGYRHVVAPALRAWAAEEIEQDRGGTLCECSRRPSQRSERRPHLPCDRLIAETCNGQMRRHGDAKLVRRREQACSDKVAAREDRCGSPCELAQQRLRGFDAEVERILALEDKFVVDAQTTRLHAVDTKGRQHPPYQNGRPQKRARLIAARLKDYDALLREILNRPKTSVRRKPVRCDR